MSVRLVIIPLMSVVVIIPRRKGISVASPPGADHWGHTCDSLMTNTQLPHERKVRSQYDLLDETYVVKYVPRKELYFIYAATA